MLKESDPKTTLFEVRKARAHERKDILDLVKRSYSEYESSLPDDFKEFYNEGNRRFILDEESVERFIAVKDEKIIGAVILCPPYQKEINGQMVTNNYPEMRLLAVDPASRNLGAAKSLIESCEKEAKNQGFNALTLHTTDRMKVAKAMYKRRNYLPYKEIDFLAFDNHLVEGFIKSFETN